MGLFHRPDFANTPAFLQRNRGMPMPSTAPVAAQSPAGVQINAKLTPEFAQILTPEALAFVAKLNRQFEPRRRELLARRAARQKEFDAGELPDFLPETKTIRESEWAIADR